MESNYQLLRLDVLVHISTTVYAVASRTYAFYSCNMIMYGTILSLGAAATVYVLIAQPTKSDSSKVVGSNMCEYVLREVGKLCTWTNEDDMVQR